MLLSTGRERPAREAQAVQFRSRRHRCPAISVSASGEGPPEAWNPQNVGKPLVLPDPSFTPSKAVSAQLDAVKANDEPRADHGVASMYEFAMDAGSMERSRYFGLSKDLYHMDHFLNIKTYYPILFKLEKYEVLSEKPDGDRCRVDVRLYDRTAPGAPVDFVFNLERQSFGSYKGCWLTKSLLPADSKWLN